MPAKKAVDEQGSVVVKAPEQSPPSKKTNFTSIILSLVVITLAATVGYLMYHNFLLTQQLNKKETTSPDIDAGPSSGFSRVDKCTKDDCLFKTDVNLEGLATIKGYYKEYEAEDWDKSMITCHGFVVTDGNQTLIKHIEDRIKLGNKLNKIIDDKLVINLPLAKIKDTDLIKKVRESNENDEIELRVVRLSPIGKGESTCSSFIDIVTAKKFEATPEPTTAKVTGSIEVEKIENGRVYLKLSAQSEVGNVKQMRVYTDKISSESWEEYNESYELLLEDVDEQVFIKYRNEFSTESEEYAVTITDYFPDNLVR
jgi:hypothetical protein